MGVGTRSSAKKTQGKTQACFEQSHCLEIPSQVSKHFEGYFLSILEEEELQAKAANRVDAETQTDPEITGVDADDFEEDDGEEESGSESSEDEEDELEAGGDGCTRSVDKGTSSKPVRRKIIELKYYFGEDLPDAELNKRKLDIDNFRSKHMVFMHKLVDTFCKFTEDSFRIIQIKTIIEQQGGRNFQV